MKKIKRIVPWTKEVEVSVCPLCGAHPDVTPIFYEREPFEGYKVKRYDIDCYGCGLKAPFGPWLELCRRLDTDKAAEDDGCPEE